MTELSFLPVSDLAPLLQQRQISPVELTRAVLDRVYAADSTLHAYITITPELATAAAAQAEQEIGAGLYRGSLHGIPLSHKDLLCTRGVRTTAHSRILADHIPDHDATVVHRLATAGAVMLGKTNTYEFGNGSATVFGTPVNPWDTARTTAGSSAGSASSVAAGLAIASTGTDGGGSLRTPASFCGVVGLKPTYGLISRFGTLPYAPSFAHVGHITRSVRDSATLLSAVAGPDVSDPGASRRPVPDYVAALDVVDRRPGRPLAGLRIGLPLEFFPDQMEPAVRVLVDKALNSLAVLGAELVPLHLPGVKWTDPIHVAIERAEALLAHREWLRTRPNDYASVTRQRLLVGTGITGLDYLRAQQLRRLLCEEFREALAKVDILAGPTTITTAFRLDAPNMSGTLMTKPANLTGIPAISVPCGFTPDGLPCGLQLMARPFDELRLLQVAHAFECTIPCAPQRPPEPFQPSYPPEFIAPQVHISAYIPDSELSPVLAEMDRTLERGGFSASEGDLDQIARSLYLTRAGLTAAEREWAKQSAPFIYPITDFWHQSVGQGGSV